MTTGTFERDRFEESTNERVGPTERIKIGVTLKLEF